MTFNSLPGMKEYKKPINVVSLFDGMSCGQIALDRIGANVGAYYASEIDKHAIKVTMSNYPDTIQIGNVIDVSPDMVDGDIDLITAGSPCQGFSFAGKQLAFDDPRSKLFFEFVRLIKELRPKYFLLENVKMAKQHERVITDILGVDPITINSNLVSAQNRNRLYWTNIPYSPIERKDVFWGDVREHGVGDARYFYSKKGMEWIIRSGERRNKRLKIHSDNEKMQMIEASHYKNYSNQRFFGIIDTSPPDHYMNIPHNIVTDSLPPGVSYRYITVKECERLQTIPDGYTKSVSKTQAYKMLGNGWTVDVIAHILRGMV